MFGFLLEKYDLILDFLLSFWTRVTIEERLNSHSVRLCGKDNDSTVI